MDATRFVRDFLKHAGKGDFILSAGCGTGEQALEIARNGFDVVGLDESSEALTKATRNARLESLPVKFHSALDEFREGMFDAVFLCFDSVTDLAGIARVLKKGGVCFCVVVGDDAGMLEDFKKHFSVSKTDEFSERQEHGVIVVGKKK